MHILINKNYLTYSQYKVKCALGKRGIGLKKKEGDLITPIGIYKIIENQLLNKLPEGINGNIFMSKDKYKKTRDKFLFL